MAIRIAFIHALSSLHAGTGQGAGAIDLPIARERATNLPYVPGSSIKGCLRDIAPDDDDKTVIFGSDDPKKPLAGALHISDARLLLFPVRSLGAPFVWTTCPYILRRFDREAALAGLKKMPQIPDLGKEQCCVSVPALLTDVGGQRKLVLEELDLASVNGSAAEWAAWIGSRLFPGEPGWQNVLSARFAIVDDASFDFLSEFATEVSAHIKINDKTGTVQDRGLWYQEALPAETVLAAVLQADRSWKKDAALTGAQVMAKVKARRLQLGGKATTGQGLVSFHLVEAAA